MSDLSARLALPYLMPSQAQKHVTHNEALKKLDLLVQLAVETLDAILPPPVPSEGQVWALGAAPTGDWAGHAFELAAWLDGTWYFETLVAGRLVIDMSETSLKIWDGNVWKRPSLPDLHNLNGIGINTGFDVTNRLSVSAPASLLSHEGAGHQLKVNKAADTDTSSLLFQTDWSGRAELGTIGSDDFAIKVSADGSAWTEALRIDGTSGILSGDAVQQDAEDITPGRLARADYTYGPGNLLGAVSQTGGVPNGAVIEHGSNANGDYVRFADGTQIAWVHSVDMGSIIAAGSGTWTSPYRTNAVSLTWPAAFAAPPAASAHPTPASTSTPLDSRALVLNTFEAPDATGWQYIRASRVGGNTYDLNVVLSVLAVGRWF